MGVVREAKGTADSQGDGGWLSAERDLQRVAEIGDLDEVAVRLAPGEALDVDVRDGVNASSPLDHQRTIDVEDSIHIDRNEDRALRLYGVARLLTSSVEILLARRLHAAVFLDRGFISPEDLASDGTIGTGKDPWSDVSSYFGVVRGGVVMAMARQISLPDTQSLPCLRLSGLAADEVSRIGALASEDVVEISALARHHDGRSSDVFAVYVRMWEESLMRHHRVWLMAADLPLYAHLRETICGAAIRPIGPPQFYLGSTVVPAALWCDELNAEQRRLAASAGDQSGVRRLLRQPFSAPTTVRS